MKRVLFIVAFLGFAGLLFVQAGLITTAAANPDVAMPTLLQPTGKVDLAGQATLKFQWSNGLGHSVLEEYYDFRVYQGTAMTSETQIYQKQVPARTFRTAVSADLFKAGQTYSWSLVHVIGAEKSASAFFTFEVVGESKE